MISWNGIGQPTKNLDKVVLVELRNKRQTVSRVGELCWEHNGTGGDIIAYVFEAPEILCPGGEPVWDADDQSAPDHIPVSKMKQSDLRPGAIFTTDEPVDKPISESRRRKEMPLARGCMDYFPDALLAVAELSFLANEKHNPGEPMHWSKGKSNDHADCVARHLLERGAWITGEYARPVRHSTAAAWRALANLQTEIEAERVVYQHSDKKPHHFTIADSGEAT